MKVELDTRVLAAAGRMAEVLVESDLDSTEQLSAILLATASTIACLEDVLRAGGEPTDALQPSLEALAGMVARMRKEIG